MVHTAIRTGAAVIDDGHDAAAPRAGARHARCRRLAMAVHASSEMRIASCCGETSSQFEQCPCDAPRPFARRCCIGSRHTEP